MSRTFHGRDAATGKLITRRPSEMAGDDVGPLRTPRSARAKRVARRTKTRQAFIARHMAELGL